MHRPEVHMQRVLSDGTGSEALRLFARLIKATSPCGHWRRSVVLTNLDRMGDCHGGAHRAQMGGRRIKIQFAK